MLYCLSTPKKSPPNWPCTVICSIEQALAELERKEVAERHGLARVGGRGFCAGGGGASLCEESNSTSRCWDSSQRTSCRHRRRDVANFLPKSEPVKNPFSVLITANRSKLSGSKTRLNMLQSKWLLVVKYIFRLLNLGFARIDLKVIRFRCGKVKPSRGTLRHVSEGASDIPER